MESYIPLSSIGRTPPLAQPQHHQPQNHQPQHHQPQHHQPQHHPDQNGSDMTTTEYTVTGMTCGHCVAHVTEEVQAVPGVADVQVTLEGGRMVVTSADALDFAAIEAAVAEAGEYTVAAN